MPKTKAPMPPKKKAPTDVPAAVMPPGLELEKAANGALLAKVQEAFNVVMCHPVFKNAMAKDPYPIDAKNPSKSGVEEPFALPKYQIATEQNNFYKAGGNFLWVNPSWSATPGIPTSEASVNKAMEHYFSSPARFPHDVVIAVMQDGGGGLQPSPQQRRPDQHHPRRTPACMVARSFPRHRELRELGNHGSLASLGLDLSFSQAPTRIATSGPDAANVSGDVLRALLV